MIFFFSSTFKCLLFLFLIRNALQPLPLAEYWSGYCAHLFLNLQAYMLMMKLIVVISLLAMESTALNTWSKLFLKFHLYMKYWFKYPEGSACSMFSRCILLSNLHTFTAKGIIPPILSVTDQPLLWRSLFQGSNKEGAACSSFQDT